MFSSLQKLLPRRIGGLDLNQYFVERQLKKAWQAVLSQKPRLDAKTLKPLYLKNGVFFVGCADMCCASELRFQETELCQMINRVLQRQAVNKIKFLSY